ncbi:MAG: transposase [Streptosporangiales bacterium]|nr:transposase [Streptosporangiales bacterium]
MAPADSLARLRKHVLDRVARGEITMVEASRQLGVSRSRLYELRDRYQRYGEAGLFPKPRPSGVHPAAVSPALRDQMVAYAVEHPTEGPRSIAWQLRKARYGGWQVSHSTVYNVLRDAGLNRRSMRLAAAEALAAAEGGPVTERALRDLRAAQAVEHTHIGSDLVGEAVFLDTMYVGNLKGAGKIWQYTGVDGACSFGFARAKAGRKSAAAMADFLEHDILPAYREAGTPLVEVITDGGPEFTGRAFGRTCARLGIRWHKLPPRSPNLNAFVERFQGSVLHLHYRTAFRYRYYHTVDHIDADLQAWLRYYNFERPHRGYRTRGRIPAAIFYTARPDLLTAKGWNLDDIYPAA